MVLRRVAIIAAAALLVSAAAHADDDDGHDHAFETRDIFGFTDGSGVGDVGETEVELDTVARVGKRDGRYAAADSKLSVEYTPNRYVQLAFGPFLSAHSISGVSGLDDSRRGGFGGLAGEIHYQLLERGAASPVGVTLSAEPEWRRFEEASGVRADGLGVEFKLSADAELVRDRLYVAANLLYEPEGTRDPDGIGAGWEMESTVGLSAALAWRFVPTATIGAEAWYLRHYDGAWLNSFTGDAVYVGPTLWLRLSDALSLTAAWNVQVAGHEAGGGGTLDLADFSRHRARLKLSVAF